MARTSRPVSEQVQEEAHTPVESRQKKAINPRNLYPTGSTMLNLACSDNHRGGFDLGTIVTVPGASAGGKTMLAMAGLGEGIHDPRFDKYDFIYDDAESALNFDMPYLFGDKVTETLKEPPLGTSRTVQEFKANVLMQLKSKTPTIYVVDSLDTLASDEELDKEFKRAMKLAKSPEAAKEIAGSYGMEKAKMMHQILRMVNDQLEDTNSLLIILQQLKENTDKGPFGKKYKTTGGTGPFFYSSHQCWLTRTSTITVGPDGNKKKIGGTTRVEVVKNKLTGKLRDIEFNIFYDYGLDNIGSMVDWLIKEKIAKQDGKGWAIRDLGLTGTRPKTTGATGTLVELIESEGLEKELAKYVGEQWNQVEESLRLNRKPRFGV